MDLSSASIALRLFAVFALVAANGLFVAAEFSIVKARRTRIAQLVRAGRRGARLVQRATENPEPFVAATQLGITMASLGLGWIGEPSVATLVGPLLAGIPTGWQPAAQQTLSAALAFGLITSLHIIFGELMPKSVALWSAEPAALGT